METQRMVKTTLSHFNVAIFLLILIWSDMTGHLQLCKCLQHLAKRSTFSLQAIHLQIKTDFSFFAPAVMNWELLPAPFLPFHVLFWCERCREKTGLLWPKLSHHSLVRGPCGPWKRKWAYGRVTFHAGRKELCPKLEAIQMSLLNASFTIGLILRKWVHVSSYRNKAIHCWLGFSSPLLLWSVKGSSVCVSSHASMHIMVHSLLKHYRMHHHAQSRVNSDCYAPGFLFMQSPYCVTLSSNVILLYRLSHRLAT